ncbi:Uncharacterised protein [uncultured archaeon]|nr:Uncharacterised protein [uncultured archaeon]
MGIMDKIFKSKKQEEPVRLGQLKRPAEEAPIPVEDEAGSRYLAAKKWREDQAMNEPLVKRSQFKKKW